MIQSFGISVFVSGMLFSTVASTAVPVSITKFTNQAGSSNCRLQWDWWERYLGNGLREMLAGELTKSGKVELYERETIGDIYEGEHNLVNSGEDKSLARGKFRKAKYTLVGAVTDFEYCAHSKGGSVNVGGIARMFGVPAPDLSIGGRGATATIEIRLRIIDTTTGRVVKTIQAEGSARDSSFQLDTDLGGYEEQSNSPMGKSAKEAIEKAAAEALRFL